MVPLIERGERQRDRERKRERERDSYYLQVCQLCLFLASPNIKHTVFQELAIKFTV